MGKKILLGALLFTAVMMLGGSVAPAGDAITLRMGFIDAAGHHYVVASEWAAEELKKRTNGTINLELYPSGQIGEEREMYEGSQFGSVDICTVVNTTLSGFIPEMAVLDQPFLFNSFDEAREVVDGKLNDMIAERMLSQGVHLAGWFESGFREVYCNRPVDKMADFKGMKLRVMENPIQVATWNAMGLIATPMTAGEIFTALQQRAIDGAEGGAHNVLIRRFFEVTNHFINTKHLFGIVAIGVSDRAYNSVPPEYRPVLMEVLKQCATLQHRLGQEMNENAKGKLQENGVTFHDIDREELKAAIGPVMENFRKNMNQEWLKVLDDHLAEIRARK